MMKRNDPEEFLRRFSRRTPPPDLRGQILQAVENKRRPVGAASQWRRKIVFASLAVIFITTAIDVVLSHSAANRISGIIGGIPDSSSATSAKEIYAFFSDATGELLPEELSSLTKRKPMTRRDQAFQPRRLGKDKIDEI
jgi:hypothetical protein